MDLTLRTTDHQAVSPALKDLNILHFLERDPRPTFVLSVAHKDAAHVPISVAYWNPALAALDNGYVLDTISHDTNPGNNNERGSLFRSWARTANLDLGSTCYAGIAWTKFLLDGTWLVMTGSKQDIVTSPSVNRLDFEKAVSNTKVPSNDWTDALPPKSMTPHVEYARSIDWSQTSLGPMDSWSPQLCSIANIVMQDPRPAVIFYGPDLIMIYNAAEIELLGGFHPCMGVSARVALASVWEEYFEPIIAQNLAGETVEKNNSSIHMVRNGYMEETYFSLRFIPILDDSGATIGHYEPLVETTRDVITQRQAQTLLALSEEIPRARSVDSYWTLATEIMSRNGRDIPFALLYSLDQDLSDSVSSTARSTEVVQDCTLRGMVGVSQDTSIGSTCLDLQQDEGFAPYLRQAMAARQPVTVDLTEASPAHLLVKNVNWQGWGDPCRVALVCPLTPTSSKDNILGFVVLGLNPRRPYDNEYHRFILVASRLLSTSLTSIILHDEEIRRRERAIEQAEAMKSDLKHQLNESQKEVERGMLKFQRFAEGVDIAIFIIGIDGVYSYRNEAWFTILNPLDRDIQLEDAWGALIDEKYVDIGRLKFEDLVRTKQHQSFELRLKRTWDAPGGSLHDGATVQQPMWVLTFIFPELSDDGEVLEIIGCCTDISQQKWAEKVQATQASNAQESKRQLENFIDTTSHEMRNPLSAVVQCADSIIAMHKQVTHPATEDKLLPNIVTTTIDAAETIVQCSKHMKTIVDDVLTISKLDSGLFTMTPVDVPFESIAKDAFKMFEGEAKAADIELEYCSEASCQQFSKDSLSLDPTRVLQILINLLTNAIKFTRLEKKRHVTVSVGASLERPMCSADGSVSFIRSSDTLEAESLEQDWAKGDVVYVIFSVADTGRGLSDEERELLFARFSQGSPRTHIDYGGSGLGLFISRRLTEMHGGAIGFNSKAKVGSTFSFYVKGRRTKSLVLTRADSNAALEINTSSNGVLAVPSQGEKEKLLTPVEQEKQDIELSDLHVLVVEDNLVNQRVLAKQLRQLGMTVAVANHGEDALAYLRTTNRHASTSDDSSKSLSLILMDWEMPVMDGLTCVRKIRDWQYQGTVSGHIPVIAVTANVRAEQVKNALEAGMDNIISKPFRIPDLCTCIQETMRMIATKS